MSFHKTESMFGVTILGNNSALPAYDRHPTSQAVTLDDQILLIDCGEGTQMQIARYKVRRSKINHIFISHMHGDHYFGLPGILTSMGLLSRQQDLHLYAPAGLKKILDLQFQYSDTRLPFTLHFHPLDQEGIILDEEHFSVECFPVYHRIECWGFLIREKKKPRKIDRSKLHLYPVPSDFYEQLKTGKDYITPQGELIRNEWLTIPNTAPRSYAYSADTIFSERLAEKVKDVSLLYHEATYLQAWEEKAASRFHSTSVQAAQIAKMAGVEKLLIGHFSSKYENLDNFLWEAKTVFPNVELAIEGVTYQV